MRVATGLYIYIYLYAVFVKDNRLGRMYEVKKIFFVYEERNVNPDWMNLEIFWEIHGFDDFQLCIKPFSRMIHLVFIGFEQS